MSFAASYMLASRVRSKLTKQAADPKSSLRLLVLQANMLDNIMDNISLRTEQMKQEKSVSFAVPEVVSHPKHPSMDINNGPSVTEYEIDSDSDSDFDSDSDDTESTSEDDEYEYYSSSISEDEEGMEYSSSVMVARKNTMPVIDLSDDNQLLVIFEENEDSLPELTHLISSSDSESEDDIHMPNYVLSTTHSNASNDSLLGTDLAVKQKEIPLTQPQTQTQPQHHHQRNDAICNIESLF